MDSKLDSCSMDLAKEENQLGEIKRWLEENPNIIIKTDDNLKLLYFLRNTKYDIERAKKKIERFAYLRLERKEWFTNRNPFLPELQELFDLGVFLPLDKKHENRQITIIRTGAHNPKKHSFDNVLKCSKMILDLLMTLEDTISIHGLVAILDMKGVQLGHALQLTPNLIKKLVEIMESYPIKVKQLEFINCPAHVNVILNTFRLFMSNKMKSRVVVRSSTSEIQTELPTNLGGTGKSYDELAKHWKSIVENNSNFYEY